MDGRHGLEGERMRRRAFGLVGLTFVLGSTFASAQEIEWRSANHSQIPPSSESPVSLGRPQRLSAKSDAAPVQVPSAAPSPLGEFIIRGQSPDGSVPPPPPPPTGALGAPLSSPAPGEEAFNCGVANTQPGEAGFFSRLCDNIKRGFSDIGNSATGVFQSRPGAMFHSDDKFNIISPVTNPFYFEDPRALT